MCRPSSRATPRCALPCSSTSSLCPRMGFSDFTPPSVPCLTSSCQALHHSMVSPVSMNTERLMDTAWCPSFIPSTCEYQNLAQDMNVPGS